nr:MAG TPA: hypothetical protein [Caudoviricetes sp.]
MLWFLRSVETPLRRPPLPENGSFYTLSRLFSVLRVVYLMMVI